MKKNKLKIGFYVSGKATRVIKILSQYSEIKESTVLILSDSDENFALSKICKAMKIQLKIVHYSRLDLKGKEKNIFLSNELLKSFKEKEVDYGFSFGGKLLQGKILVDYKNRLINFHPSLLPHFPGINSIDKALKGDVNLLGNTAHFIDEGIDTGPVIMQSVIHISKFVDYNSVLDLQLPMINQIFKWLTHERINVVDDKVKILNPHFQVSFFPKIENSEFK
jgi:phosphoribosylglycinamide formyltransferase-1